MSREGTVETLNRLQRLTGYGVVYRSFTEQYLDSTGIFKDAVIGMLAAVAKQERVRLSERTKAGLECARAQGNVGGRPKSEDVDHKLVAKIMKLRNGCPYRLSTSERAYTLLVACFAAIQVLHLHLALHRMDLL